MLACVLACVFLGLGTAGARAQFTRFENYSDERGLGNTSVSALAQDADGYILLGTEAGLYRYDGSRITPYDVSVGLPPGEWVRKIMIDRAGRTWVVTSDDIFVRYDQRFTRVDVGAALDVRSPHLITLAGDSVIVDNGGRFLRAFVGAHAVGRFLPLFDQAMLAATPDLSQARFVEADTDGALLIGCGQAICRMKDGRITAFGPEAGLPPDAWRAAIRTPDGTLWVRSVGRLAWRGPHDASFQVVTIPDGHGQSYNRIPSYLDLVADRRGGILTQGGDGLLDWDGTRWRSYGHHEGGLSATPIEALMFDREESLWIGSMGHGAFRSVGLGNWEHWTADDGLPSDLIWGMTRLRDGQFWVATFGDTVALDNRPDSVPGNIPRSLVRSIVRSIPGGSAVVQASRDGRLWAAPPDQPLARFDGARNKLERFPVSAHVSTALLDRDDRLWLCTAGGLYLIADADAPAPAVHPELVLSHVAFQVVLDPSGAVWALTRDGLFRRDAAGRFDLVAAAVLPDGQSGGMAFTPEGDLWVFTESEGVLRFHPGPAGLRRLSPLTASVLGSNDVLFLHRDGRGWMWVGTDHGIDVFDGRSWRRFDKVDGLISDDMDQGSVYEDGDGSMWFGTSHGLSHLLDPTRPSSATTLHPLVTGVSVGRRSLSPSPSIRIDGSTASLVVRFVDLDYARGNVAFRYRLRGLDTGWNDTMGHDVRYAGLPAGEFRFELVAVDTVHGEVSAPVGFTLHIRAPWWRRVWFYGLCALLAAAVLVGAWQGRVRLLLGRQRRLEEMVGARTAEIEQARNELQRLAMSDVLTGLPNRRAIMGALDEAVAAASRNETVLAVLLCDIDHFKSINDRFGHLAGDKVLAAFGGRLGAVISAGETAGRYGGEEFLVVLPGAPDLVMERVAAIRSAISGPPYQFGDGSRVVTSSGGVAFLRPSDTTVTLVARADVALYKAKENGRNRIEMESPDSGPGSPQGEAAAVHHGSPARLQVDAWNRTGRGGSSAGRPGARPASGAGRRAVRPALPAGGRHRAGRGHVVRGAAALAVANPRQRVPGRLHPVRRNHRADAGDRRLGAARRLPRGDGMAGNDEGFGQPVAVAVPPAGPGAEDRGDPGGNRVEAGPAGARGDGNGDDRRHGGGLNHARTAQGAGHQHRAGRFRHRLLVAELPAHPAVHPDQDRQVVRAGAGREAGSRRHRARHRRPVRQPGRRCHRRRGRDRPPDRAASRAGLRGDPGVPHRPPVPAARAARLDGRIRIKPFLRADVLRLDPCGAAGP